MRLAFARYMRGMRWIKVAFLMTTTMTRMGPMVMMTDKRGSWLFHEMSILQPQLCHDGAELLSTVLMLMLMLMFRLMAVP